MHHTVAELVFLSKRVLWILMKLQQIFNSKVTVTPEETHNTWASFPFLLPRINTESPFMSKAPCVVLLPFQYSTYVHRNNTSNFEMQLSKERQRRKICTFSSLDLLNQRPPFPEESYLQIPCCSAGPSFLMLSLQHAYVVTSSHKNSPGSVCSQCRCAEYECSHGSRELISSHEGRGNVVILIAPFFSYCLLHKLIQKHFCVYDGKRIQTLISLTLEPF